MIKKWLSIIIIILFSFLLQTTLFHHLKLAGVIPNLLIIATVSVGYIFGQKTGLVTGFICGLLSDLMFGSVIGLHAMIYMFTGCFFSYGSKKYWQSKMSVPLILITIADIFYNILFYIFEFLLRGKMNFLNYFKLIIFPEAVYTLVIALVFYSLIRLIFKFVTPSINEEDI